MVKYANPAQKLQLPIGQDLYRELTVRNRAFIDEKTQKALREFRILVAGCGSTGGACIESLARLGVENFVLADSGSYELNNLNRQHANLQSIDQNKAEFHAKQLLAINPGISVEVHPEGVTLNNVRSLLKDVRIVMDGVDVTSPSGMAMKLALHEAAKEAGLPVLTALDIGFSQWGESYDYRRSGFPSLGGRLEDARQAKHPLKALFTFVPLSAVPPHALEHVRDLLTGRVQSASQLGCSSDLLSAIIVPAIVRFVTTGDLVSGWDFRLEKLAFPRWVRALQFLKSVKLRSEIRSILRKTA